MTQPKIRIGFFASRSGSVMNAILQAIEVGTLSGYEARLLIVSNPNCGALAIAKEKGLAAISLSGKGSDAESLFDHAMREALAFEKIDIIFLSGYMKLIGPLTLSVFEGRILNIHPALLPAFGGQGMYGDHVHKAVLEAGVAETGATVHLIDAQYDTGPVILQDRVLVVQEDNIESLRTKVQLCEREVVIRALQKIQMNIGSSHEPLLPEAADPEVREFNELVQRIRTSVYARASGNG